MSRKLLIIGAGGHGKVIADIALRMHEWDTVQFLDDREDVRAPMEVAVIGKASDAFQYLNDYDVIVGIGNNAIRNQFQKSLEASGASIPTLIHPDAVIGSQVELGAGTAIMAGAVINCCTKIGKGCIVNTGATLDHDNFIEDYVHISPGAHTAGTVHLGKRTWLGIGSIVSNNLNITENCIIGAGSVVIKDVTEAGIYVGVPIRKLESMTNRSIP